MKTNIKKEFNVTWVQENVITDTGRMPIMRSKFFNFMSGSALKLHSIVVPDGLTYNDLLLLEGKRTKVTIEILP